MILPFLKCDNFIVISFLQCIHSIGKGSISNSFVNITSSCDLPTLYHEGMIKSNPTKGGNYVAMVIMQ